MGGVLSTPRGGVLPTPRGGWRALDAEATTIPTPPANKKKPPQTDVSVGPRARTPAKAAATTAAFPKYSFATVVASPVAKRTPSSDTESACTKRQAPTSGAASWISRATDASDVKKCGKRPGPQAPRTPSIAPSAMAPPIIVRSTRSAFRESRVEPTGSIASGMPEHESSDDDGALFEATAGRSVCLREKVFGAPAHERSARAAAADDAYREQRRRVSRAAAATACNRERPRRQRVSASGHDGVYQVRAAARMVWPSASPSGRKI